MSEEFQTPIEKPHKELKMDIPSTQIHDHFLGFVQKGNNKITELRTILQRESQNS
jgi:hypothetical protein